MLLGAVAAAIALGAGSVPPATGASAVGVGAHEYYYVLSRQHVSAGPVTVQLYNGGEDPHNLKIVNRNGFEFRFGRAQPGQAITHSVNLSPGRYRLVCTVADDAQKGMRVHLRVRR